MTSPPTPGAERAAESLYNATGGDLAHDARKTTVRLWAGIIDREAVSPLSEEVERLRAALEEIAEKADDRLDYDTPFESEILGLARAALSRPGAAKEVR